MHPIASYSFMLLYIAGKVFNWRQIWAWANYSGKGSGKLKEYLVQIAAPIELVWAGAHKKLIAFFEAKEENNWHWRRIRYS